MTRARDISRRLRAERDDALRYSWALRHMARAGLYPDHDPLTDDHLLCQWDGDLLPLEDIDMRPQDRHMDHGTNRGYQQHRAAGDVPCTACNAAHRDYNAQYRAARRSA